jgi:regulator of nucleoside diphosphate kinase
MPPAAAAAADARPPIVLCETEADRLYALAAQAHPAAREPAALLLEELDRAELRAPSRMPETVARMHSIVRFVDGAHGQARSVMLVWPGEADIAAGKVSILTHVGAGLIGLSPHQSISWPDRDGRERPLRVLEVKQPAKLQF